MSRSITCRLAVVTSILSLAGCAGQPQAESPITVQMDCGLLPVTVTYVGDRATVIAGETTLELARVRSASGAKYQQADDEQTFFWSKGDSAQLQIAGRPWPECVRHGALPAPFQARGNEPFWHVEVNHGQLTLRTPGNPEPDPVPSHHQTLTDHGHRFSATVDGLDLVLDVHREVCQDSMSGMPYPYRAELLLNQALARGCAGQPEHLLQGAEWTVTALDGEPVAGNASATIEFFNDGLVAGRAFCNRYTGRHELSGEGVRIGPLASTKMACAGPLMTLENHLLQRLEQVNRFDIGADGELILSTTGGQQVTARLHVEP